MSTQNKDWLCHILASITIVLWASSYVLTPYALQSYSPTALSLLRYMFGAAALVIFGCIKRIGLPKLLSLIHIYIFGTQNFNFSIFPVISRCPLHPAAAKAFDPLRYQQSRLLADLLDGRFPEYMEFRPDLDVYKRQADHHKGSRLFAHGYGGQNQELFFFEKCRCRAGRAEPGGSER